jgi:hypothetical protein
MVKTYIQCGYEDKCKKKDCLKCPRKFRHNISLTLAEEICIEDFAVCDIQAMTEEERGLKELELMQDIMRKLMFKIYKDKRK